LYVTQQRDVEDRRCDQQHHTTRKDDDGGDHG
jgi:hypothetical protein